MKRRDLLKGLAGLFGLAAAAPVVAAAPLKALPPFTVDNEWHWPPMQTDEPCTTTTQYVPESWAWVLVGTTTERDADGNMVRHDCYEWRYIGLNGMPAHAVPPGAFGDEWAKVRV